MRTSTGAVVARALQGLAPESRLRLRVFAFKLLFIIPVSMVLARGRGFPLLITLSFFCLWHSAFAALAAMVRRQSPVAADLTAWDEAMAFFALALAIRFVGAVLA
jgi:hypothetical protein